ncbi:MAG: respiratory nitrate reductase subunit gamma [Blastopirellula sp.]|nr:MAG: respiratory nitrate reductase subunit gamma [Blastopirellula sp.]
MNHFLDQFMFVALPYVCLFTFFLMTIYRYQMQSFSYSSLSSQFLENKHHFWAVVPFHYGILVVAAGHFIAFLIPRTILLWNAHPLRLYVLEVSALAFGLLTLVGLIGIVVRRFSNTKIRYVTTYTDWILFAMLMLQTISGVGVALFHPWGSSWFASNLSPYLWSIVILNPDISFVVALPFLVKFHIVLAFLTIGFFPFTRLVHVLVIPNPYLWRKPQVVRWYGRR